MLNIKLTHRRRIRQKRRPSLLFVGRTVLYLNAALAIYCSSYVYLKESFGRRSILVWCGVNRMIKCSFFLSSFSSNHPSAKSLMRHGMKTIQPPNQQRRPLPSLLSDSSSMSWPICVCSGGSSQVCDLCGSPNALLSCAACHMQNFCAACDDMYHKHPRRSEHVRKVSYVTSGIRSLPVLSHFRYYVTSGIM